MAEIVGGEWLTVEEAAELAKLSDWTIYRACELGELRHVRVSGRRAIRLTREALDEWLLRYQRPSAPEPSSARVKSGRR
jgi:excisionase family DNA binding protein